MAGHENGAGSQRGDEDDPAQMHGCHKLVRACEWRGREPPACKQRPCPAAAAVGAAGVLHSTSCRLHMGHAPVALPGFEWQQECDCHGAGLDGHERRLQQEPGCHGIWGAASGGGWGAASGGG